MDIIYYGGLALTGFVAGLLGALLGLGGGVFVVPALVLIFGIRPLFAVGTSNVAVVATSTAGAASYVRSRLGNVRLALVLLVSTTAAALVSSLVASFLPDRVLSGLFAFVLLYVGINMLRTRKEVAPPPIDATESDPLGMTSSFYDAAMRKHERYRPRNIGKGMGTSALAGVVAGLLGVGGGIIQVPVMSMMMGVPLKVAAATSNFMIGATATSSAIVRYTHGDINPLVAVPIALSVFLGARVGAWLVPRTPSGRLKLIFGYVALVIAGLMLLQAFGIYSPPKK